MMSALAKRHMGIWKILLALFSVSVLFGKSVLYSAGGKGGAGLTYEQYLLSAVTDHYYTIYFVLPVVLLSCFTFIEDDSEIVIGRFRSYFCYFMKKWAGTALIAGEIVLFQSAGILLSGIGLPSGNTWLLPEGALEAELFSVLGSYFSTPLRAFSAALLYEFAGIWMLSGTAMWICRFTGRKQAVRIFMTLYVYSALWIKIPFLLSLPVTGLNHLLVLHHNLTAAWRLPITMATAVFLLLALVWSVRFFGRSAGESMGEKRHGNGMGRYYFRRLFSVKNRMILLACAGGITLYQSLRNPFSVSGEEYLYTLFYGHGTGYFQAFPFLEMMIVAGTPLYLLAVFAEREVSEQSIFIPIRLKNRRELMAALLTAGMGFVAFYSVLWGIVGVAGMVCSGHILTGDSVKILVCAVGMKWLDIFLQYILMLLFSLCTKRITAGFLALEAGNLLCTVPWGFSAFMPFGLSCMARIACFSGYPGIHPLIAGGGLFLGILLVSGWLLLFGQKKLVR